MACLVETIDEKTLVTTEFGDAEVTLHEKSPTAYGRGLATLSTCAILNTILTAKSLGANRESPFITQEFCKECASLVSLTVAPV